MIYARGYIPRDYRAVPEFSQYQEYTGKMYPKSDWVELIELQKENKTSPYDVHKHNKVPVLDQGRYGYCWMYGTVACVLNRYAAQGLDPVPALNAHGTAALVKNFRNQGGFGVEAAKGIQKFGIPEFKVWPKFSNDRSLQNKASVKANSKKHKLVTFEELPRNAFEAVMSALICPIDPVPLTLAYSDWRHLVGGMRAVYRGSGRSLDFGIEFVNSWTERYGEKGYGTRWGKKAVPFESVVVRSVKAREENNGS